MVRKRLEELRWRFYWWRRDRRERIAVEVIDVAMTSSEILYVHPRSGGPARYEVRKVAGLAHDHIEGR